MDRAQLDAMKCAAYRGSSDAYASITTIRPPGSKRDHLAQHRSGIEQVME